MNSVEWPAEKILEKIEEIKKVVDKAAAAAEQLRHDLYGNTNRKGDIPKIEEYTRKLADLVDSNRQYIVQHDKDITRVIDAVKANEGMGTFKNKIVWAALIILAGAIAGVPGVINIMRGI